MGQMTIVGIVIIGFLAGLVARLLMPGPNNPRGFILTTILGVAGAGGEIGSGPGAVNSCDGGSPRCADCH
jgi:hypothetical protein